MTNPSWKGNFAGGRVNDTKEGRRGYFALLQAMDELLALADSYEADVLVRVSYTQHRKLRTQARKVAKFAHRIDRDRAMMEVHES